MASGYLQLNRIYYLLAGEILVELQFAGTHFHEDTVSLRKVASKSYLMTRPLEDASLLAKCFDVHATLRSGRQLNPRVLRILRVSADNMGMKAAHAKFYIV